MTRSQKITYQFFAQTVLLFMIYAALALLGAVKFISPDDPLAVSLPYQQISALTHIALNLAVITGLLGGGLYVTLDAAADKRLPNEPLLAYTGQLWSGFIVVALLAGLFGFSAGRQGLELPSVLAVVQLVLVGLVGVNVALKRKWSPPEQVWLVGLAAHGLALLIGLAPAPDYLHDRVLRVLAVGVNTNMAYVLMALALGFWLMHRFSNITPAWADTGVIVMGGWAALAGVLVTLPGLYPLGAPDWLLTLGRISLFVIPVCYLVIAAHSYKAFSDRNPTRTLAGHWLSLGIVLLLLGPGFLGAIQALPGVMQWTVGTRLSDLQGTLTGVAALAVTLGVINQGTIELRGINRRVTGLIPFWLVAFGVIGGGLALAGAGIVQVYMERISGAGYLDVQMLVIPLYIGWAVGGVLAALGAGVYGLTFWIRRPVERGG